MSLVDWIGFNGDISRPGPTEVNLKLLTLDALLFDCCFIMLF